MEGGGGHRSRKGSGEEGGGLGILGGQAWRHMQADAGAGIITHPDQESLAAQGHRHQCRVQVPAWG